MQKLITSLFMAILVATTSFISSTASAVAQGIYITPNVESLNVRAGPGTNYAIVGVLRRGEQVRFLEDEDWAWIKVDYQGYERYVYSSYVSKLLPAAAAPAPVRVAPAPAPVYVPAPASRQQGGMPQVADYANYNDYLNAYYAYVGGSSAPSTTSYQVTQPAPVTTANCDIKGNVSISTGERIYHVPGGRYYNSTVINPRYGERWFCSEEEAINAGWRRSMQ